MTPEQRERLRATAKDVMGVTRIHDTTSRLGVYYAATGPADVLALLDALDAAEKERDKARTIIRGREGLAGLGIDSDKLAVEIALEQLELADAAKSRATALEALLREAAEVVEPLLAALVEDFVGSVCDDEDPDEAVGGGLEGDMALKFGRIYRLHALAAKLKAGVGDV